jgi:hypothetical protein
LDLAVASTEEQAETLLAARTHGQAKSQAEGLDDSLRAVVARLSDITAELGMHFGPQMMLAGGALAGIGGIAQIVGPHIGGIGTALGDLGKFIMSPTGLIVGAVALIGVAAWDVYQHWDGVTHGISTAWHWLGDEAAAAVGFVVDTWNGGIGFVESIPGRVWDALKDAGSWLVGLGHDLLIGFWNGMVAEAKNIVGDIGQFFWNLVPGPVKHLFDSNSPSRLMMAIGSDVGRGFGIGIKGEGNFVRAAGLHLGKMAIPEVGQLIRAGGSLPSSLAFARPSAPAPPPVEVHHQPVLNVTLHANNVVGSREELLDFVMQGLRTRAAREGWLGSGFGGQSYGT